MVAQGFREAGVEAAWLKAPTYHMTSGNLTSLCLSKQGHGSIHPTGLLGCSHDLCGCKGLRPRLKKKLDKHASYHSSPSMGTLRSKDGEGFAEIGRQRAVSPALNPNNPPSGIVTKHSFQGMEVRPSKCLNRDLSVFQRTI